MNDDNTATKMEILAEGEGTLTFWWKVSSDSGDELQFLLDGVEQNYIDGEVAWQQKQYTVTGSGTHSFLWQYVKDSYDYAGEDCGWVDYVQWTGSPPSGGTSWETVTYTYDPSGRRIEKDVDGDTTTYVYDGGNVIAEYDDNGDLAGKYIHGARVDELLCMIHVADSNAVYYYHYDGLDSVVALSNSYGNSSYSYEYSAFGQPVGSDPNFTANPYLFTGRRFDYETGLYYYRARYYNPYIGRFLQTDPMGYDDGINWYVYCGNNPLNYIDPTGCTVVAGWEFGSSVIPSSGGRTIITLTKRNTDGTVGDFMTFMTYIEIYYWAIATDCCDVSTYLLENMFISEPNILESNASTSGVATAGMAIAITQMDGPLPVADAIVLGAATYVTIRYYTRYLNSKSREEYNKHVRVVEELRDQLEKLKNALKNSKGPKRKKPLEELIKEIEKKIKGHIKEMKQKWPNLPI
jgi:RHS repeat-associated protein